MVKNEYQQEGQPGRLTPIIATQENDKSTCLTISHAPVSAQPLLLPFALSSPLVTGNE